MLFCEPLPATCQAPRVGAENCEVCKCLLAGARGNQNKTTKNVNPTQIYHLFVYFSHKSYIDWLYIRKVFNKV